MFKALIVDDQLEEREGIRFLIDKYKLKLDPVEMSNGEEAFQYLLENHVDILLTDIKMPFMDGLELTRRARELDENLKIIIFSAHGEFEYAKQAIAYKVEHYILKPIEVGEFLQVMESAITLCEQAAENKRQARTFENAHRMAAQYEKKQLLWELLHSGPISDSLRNRVDESGIRADLERSVMLLVDAAGRLFDADGLDFAKAVRECVPGEHDVLNLHEYQSVVFLKTGAHRGTNDELVMLGEQLNAHLQSRFGMNMCMAIAGPVEEAECVCGLYQQMESVLENRFFAEGSKVFLLAGSDDSLYKGPIYAADSVLETVCEQVRSGRFDQAAAGIDRLFREFSASGSHSAIYVKYLCTEIAKNLFAQIPERGDRPFRAIAESLYKTNHIEDVKRILLALLDEANGESVCSPAKSTSKAIEQIMAIIHSEYMNDLGLDYVADKVYMSSKYVSNLFKKETGQSFMKALTAHRMYKAEQLLRETNKKVADISIEVGYPNTSYFCNLFKSYFGTSPAQFRERGYSRI
ncbi:response regulator [Paenibacillus contaminans]|uniref:DNA-binding response regulator n=1 Tax=Paenibacillus contaminans TaxID=450362 RepID=A0A329MN13_9BACL|nr:response regulator [Paenibacillus contaminans]RAV21279.1 hypothetical protein DQG23_11515 [Paenibacillus contaminans]